MTQIYNARNVWLVLVLLTVSTYLLGKLEFSGTLVAFTLLLTAAIKATLIMRDFMGLRGVSILWRSIMYGWLLIVCSGIAISYIISL